MSEAQVRALRTAAQGAVVVVLITVLPILRDAVSGGVENVDWAVTGYAALTAALTAVASYVMAKLPQTAP